MRSCSAQDWLALCVDWYSVAASVVRAVRSRSVSASSLWPICSARHTWKSASRNARVAASASSMAFFSCARCLRRLPITVCMGLPASCRMPDSMMRRAANASRASSAEGCTMNQPLRGCTCTKPRACSCTMASRTTVRLTAKLSASSCSPSRAPGASFCARTASTMRSAMWRGEAGVIARRCFSGVRRFRRAGSRLYRFPTRSRPWEGLFRRAPHVRAHDRYRPPTRPQPRSPRSCRSGCPERVQCR